MTRGLYVYLVLAVLLIVLVCLWVNQLGTRNPGGSLVW